MKTVVIFVITLVLFGCGGDFATGFTPLETPESDSAARGGSPSTGGRPGTGGAPDATGGVVGTGGAPVATGGAPSTGGVVVATGGAPAVVDAGCTLVTHDNGLGGTWEDCVPLYTYNVEQAMKACRASGAVICVETERCGFNQVQGYNADRSVGIGEWGYENFAKGYVYPDFGICSTGTTRHAWT